MDNDAIKKCYKCDQVLLDNLNVVYNESNFMAVFWNKYQIIVYENHDFQSAAKSFTPDFQIKHLMITDNYLSCLDYTGALRVGSLKFKNTQNHSKNVFHPREQDVVACTLHYGHYTISLKFEYGSYLLSMHRIDSEFPLIKRVVLSTSDGSLPVPDDAKYILKTHHFSNEEFDSLKVILDANDYKSQNSLVLVSFDKFTIYGCLFGPSMADDEVKLVKLYTCPGEICNIEISKHENLNIYIGLNIGTIIQLSPKICKEPRIIHMNTSISKLLVYEDSVIYTDGISMWKSQKIFSECEITFSQYFVKNVRDFIKFGDRLLCTTFSKILYVFPFDDDSCYLRPETKDEYCSAEKLMNNSEYIYNIIEEVNRNDGIIKKLNEEGNYITALSLSNRQDIMKDVIHCTAIVYDNYEDIKDYPKLMLPEDIVNYFEKDSFLFLITITITSIQHMFKQTLCDIFKKIKIHITLFSDQKQLKTYSIHIAEEKKKLDILLSLKGTLLSDSGSVKVYIEIVSNIPGSLDAKETIWACLYRTTIILNSIHFIRPNITLNNCLKTPVESSNDMILMTTVNQYGNLFKIENSRNMSSKVQWSTYIKLPDSYKEILKTEQYSYQHLNTKKANFISQQYKSDEFLNSKSNISFTIGNERVNLEIIDDTFSKPLLKVTSANIKLAYNMRNFFSNIIYGDFDARDTSKEFVNHTFYTTVEDLHKSVKECITTLAPEDKFFTVFEQFERNVMGGLPL